MAFFCAGATHGTAKKRVQGNIQNGSKPTSLSQDTTPVSPGGFNASFSGDERGRSQDLTLTLPHSNTQDLKKKMIVVQKYEPSAGEKGLAVNRGATVLLIREEGDWMYVRNENGGEGFVPRSHLLSPSATRTRTNSRSGSGSRQVIVDRGQQNGNTVSGSVPMHYTQSAGRPQRFDTIHTHPHPHHVDDYPHHITNGHPPTLTANAAAFDQKYSPSSSSGVASLVDPISPGSNQSPTQDADRAPSSNSSLDHSHGSYSSCEQCVDINSRPTLISPLNHMDKGAEPLGRGGAIESDEMLSHMASGRTTSDSNLSSAVVRPSQTVVDRDNHYIDETTNHVYGMLEDNHPPPPIPPRRIPGYSASQDPDATYSQLDHGMVRDHKTRSQEAIVHPSHRGPSCTEGWTKEKRFVSQPPQDAVTPTENDYQKLQKKPRHVNYKEVVEFRRNSKKGVASSPQGDKKNDRVASTEKTGEERPQTTITKFRKTFWGVFVVTTDFEPLDENEVGVQKGEHVSVWNQDDRDWFWVVRHTSSSSEEGFVPSVCLREVSSEPKHASAVESVESLRHNSYSSTPRSSPRPEDISVDRMRQRSSSHESRRSTSAAQHHRPSSGGSSSSGRCTRKTSDGSTHSQRLRNRVPSNLSIQKSELAPTPPSSPPPPYSEIDSNRQFVSLSQQPPDTQTHGQHQGINNAMHRTRSQGYATSRSARFQQYPSPSTPQNELGGGGGGGNSQLSNTEGTLV